MTTLEDALLTGRIPTTTAPSSPHRDVIESLFQIVDRQSQVIDFRLSPAQTHLDAEWSRRNIITKIRQHNYISTYIIARYVAKCLNPETPNRRCVIISAEADATARLLERARFMIRNLKLEGANKPSIGRDRTDAITFDRTNSWLWIGTAGSRVFGRGDTVSDLLLTEAAFYPNAAQLASGILPAAELGEVTVESTGNGRGNWFHRNAVNAREGRGYKLFFYGWVGVETCRYPLTEEQRFELSRSLDIELEEPQLYHEHGISLEQIAWRRERIHSDYEGDLSKFKENYPRTFDECFQATGATFFRKVNFSKVLEWHHESRLLDILEGHPKPNGRYGIGGDVSGGVGRDNSVLEVFDLDTLEQVAEWASADVEPHAFGEVAYELGKRFNWAYMNIERNNHGLTTLTHLVGKYPLDRLHRGTYTGSNPAPVVLSRVQNYGTYTSGGDQGTRGIIIGEGRKMLGGRAVIHSPALQSELDTFSEQSSGKIEADSGCYDDRVMAACLILSVVERAQLATFEEPQLAGDDERTPDPFSFEAMFPHAGDETGRSRNSYEARTYGVAERFG